MTYPLYIVTGFSGSGKTVTAPEVRKVVGEGFNVYDMDAIVADQDYHTASRNWLKIAYANALSGHKTILFGAVPYPYDISNNDYYKFFNPVHYLLLHCNDEVRLQRLTDRGKWTQVGIQQAIDYSNKLYRETQSTSPEQPIIDTSDLPIVAVVEKIKIGALSH